MTRAPELSFGDIQVDRAVEIAARAYGDDLLTVMSGACTRDRRCLSAAASGLHRAGVMSLDAASDALGLSVKAVRVARHRRTVGFLSAEACVVADVLGEDPPAPVAVEPVRREVVRANCQAPGACAAKPRGYGHCRACEVVARPKRQSSGPRRASGGRHRGPMPLAPALARKIRYARWFLDAGWPKSTTAGLFNINPKTLDRALVKTAVKRG